MERLIEIVRKLGMSIIWILGGGASLLCIISGALNDSNEFIIVGLGLFILTFVISKLINWIFK